MQKKISLILTGGGARAAYQVGALCAISEIIQDSKSPFSIISGFSAGAINGAWLASKNEDFKRSTQNMWDQWSNISFEKVYDIKTLSLIRIALKWVKDRGLGGLSSLSQINYLLNTQPLDSFIRENIDFENLNKNLESGILYGLSVTSVNFRTGLSTSFYNGSKEIEDWKKFNRKGIRSKIIPEYILASAAIPILFPPVKIGDSYYGDGMVRMQAPMSPSIHMGAKKILIIGARNARSASKYFSQSATNISVGEIAGTILNGLFFDSLDADLDRMQRINRTLSVIPQENLKLLTDNLRKIPVLNLRPSRDLSDLSGSGTDRLPKTLKHFLKGIGVTSERGKDMLSFLSFDKLFLKSLLELGYDDTHKRKDEILNFFETV